MKSCTTEARPHRDVATHLLHLFPRVLCRLVALAGRAEPGETRGQTKTGWESTGTGYLHTGTVTVTVTGTVSTTKRINSLQWCKFTVHSSVSTRFQENIENIFNPVFPPSNL